MRVDSLVTRVTDAIRHNTEGGRQAALEALGDAYQDAVATLRLNVVARRGVALSAGVTAYSWADLGLSRVTGIVNLDRRSPSALMVPCTPISNQQMTMLRYRSPVPVSWEQAAYTTYGTSSIELWPPPGAGETIDLIVNEAGEPLGDGDQSPQLLPIGKEHGLVYGALVRLAPTYPQRVNLDQQQKAWEDWLRDVRRLLSQYESETPMRVEVGYPGLGPVPVSNDRDWR